MRGRWLLKEPRVGVATFAVKFVVVDEGLTLWPFKAHCRRGMSNFAKTGATVLESNRASAIAE